MPGGLREFVVTQAAYDMFTNILYSTCTLVHLYTAHVYTCVLCGLLSACCALMLRELWHCLHVWSKATKWSSSRFISTTTTSAAWLKSSRVELEWQILCGNGWRINYLLCLFACLMVQTKATKWSNTGTLPPTATVATEPTATVACLHWLTNQMLKTWAGCTTKAS